MDTQASQSHKSEKGFLSDKAKASGADDETNAASVLSASGDVQLKAGGNAAIAGSQIAAGQALSVEGDSVSVIGAEERHAASASEKKSGLFVGSGGGFISLYGSKAKTEDSTATQNVASVLYAGTDARLAAREADVNVMGSSVEAGQDLTLSAARDVNVTPGAEDSASSSQTKRSGFGINISTGSGSVSVGIGLKKTTDKVEQSAETNALSSLSAGRDLTIEAGRDVNLQAVNASAERDAVVAAARDVNLLSALDSSNYAHMHEDLFAGVTLTVGTSLVNAAQATGNAVQKIGNISDGYSAANAAFAGLKAYDAVKPVLDGNIASASLTIGFQHSKQTDTQSSQTPVVSVLTAGNSVSVEAATGNLTASGAQIAAGYDANGLPLAGGEDYAGNILLKAGKDILLQSVGSSATSSSSNRSASVGIGIGANLNVATGVSVGLTGNAAASSGSSKSSSTEQVNTHVDGLGNVTLQSGQDTTLKGAVVTGETVTVNAGRDLEIASVPDEGEKSNKSVSGGVSIGGGKSLLSGIQIGGGAGSGETNWISEQSGLVSTDAMTVTVDGNTHLDAGKIVSESGDLKLDTGTLTHRDASGAIRYEGVDVSIGIDLAGGKDANHTLEGTYQLDDTRQEVRATVGPGEITIRDEEQQAALESEGATDPLADLNRDPDRAYEITRDKHVEIEAYISTQSLKAATTAGKTIVEAVGEALDRMVQDNRVSQADMTAIRGLVQYSDDPSVIAQLQSCGQQRGDIGSSIFDWIIPSAHAQAAACMVAIDGKTWTITPAGAAACLSILETAASVAYGAAKQVATRAVLGAVFAMLDPTQIGSSIDETHRLSDGTKLHVTGQSDELVRHVLVTLPTGQNVSLVLLHNGQGYSLQSGTALGATLSPSMLADMAGRLSRGGVMVVYNEKSGSGNGNNASVTSGSGAASGAPDPDEEDKAKLISNPKHHPNSSSPQPKNTQELYDNSIVDKNGIRWAKDAEGNLHRFSKPSNGETHWNGSTAGVKPIQTRDIPNYIKQALNYKG